MNVTTKATADLPYIDPGRKPGVGRIGQSLALAAFALAIATTIAAFLFWNLLLPFYGLLYLWGAH
ncbi:MULTISPECIES: hypothetical protein [unclassified Brucella]|uniref:hypothetical protein n=1 Tax=unclassified Brucella TaxID=2632610 RepID=UPI001FCF26B6|nr:MULTISPECIES: hypothetical protein [unclassified Brucella]